MGAAERPGAREGLRCGRLGLAPLGGPAEASVDLPVDVYVLIVLWVGVLGCLAQGRAGKSSWHFERESAKVTGLHRLYGPWRC